MHTHNVPHMWDSHSKCEFTMCQCVCAWYDDGDSIINFHMKTHTHTRKQGVRTVWMPTLTKAHAQSLRISDPSWQSGYGGSFVRLTCNDNYDDVRTWACVCFWVCCLDMHRIQIDVDVCWFLEYKYLLTLICASSQSSQIPPSPAQLFLHHVHRIQGRDIVWTMWTCVFMCALTNLWSRNRRFNI